MAEPIRPVAKCIYLCDDVVGNPISGKVTILNLLDTIQVPLGATFPYCLGKLCVFTWWRGGAGHIQTWIAIIQASTGTAVRRTRNFGLNFKDRTISVYAKYYLEDCLFPEPGTYVVEVYCEGRFVDDQALQVLEG